MKRLNERAGAPEAFSFSGGEALWCQGAAEAHRVPNVYSRPLGFRFVHERPVSAAKPIVRFGGRSILHEQPAVHSAFAIADPALQARRGRALRSIFLPQSSLESLIPASRGESRLPQSPYPFQCAQPRPPALIELPPSGAQTRARLQWHSDLHAGCFQPASSLTRLHPELAARLRKPCSSPHVARLSSG